MSNCPFTSQESKTVVVESIETRTVTNDSTLNTLNTLLPETKSKKNQEYLENPQLASAMKEGTKTIHTAAENSVFTKRFLNGTITKDEYGRYINSLYFIYKTLEDLLEKYKENAIIKNIYFPYELNRQKALLKDLEYYYGKSRVAELTDFSKVTPATKNYIVALKDCAERNPGLLIAHSYSRYLGDLSGGQILAKRLKKFVLKLDVTDPAWDSNQGLEFYTFANVSNNNEFKNLYRQRLDEAKVTQYTKDAIIAESIYSFELNIGLFDEIQALSESNKLERTLDEGEDYSSNKSKSSLLPSSDWLVGFTTGIVAISVGFAIYRRVNQAL